MLIIGDSQTRKLDSGTKLDRVYDDAQEDAYYWWFICDDSLTSKLDWGTKLDRFVSFVMNSDSNYFSSSFARFLSF